MREIQEQLGQLAFDVNADLLAATDDSGRVVAVVGPRAPAVPRGTKLGALRAMQRALDPNVPADSGGLAVLRIASGYLQVAVYPLVQDGFTIGALVMGEPLDSAVARARAAVRRRAVLLTAGSTAIVAVQRWLAHAGPRKSSP